MSGASRALSFGLPETSREFLCCLVKGKHQSGSQESVWNGHALKSVFNSPDSTYVAISSAGDKMQVGDKKKQLKYIFQKDAG